MTFTFFHISRCRSRQRQHSNRDGNIESISNECKHYSMQYNFFLLIFILSNEIEKIHDILNVYLA